MTPFLTIVTRCCHRPKMLAVNIKSVLAQTDRSIEQIFIVDEEKRGLHLANKALYQSRDRVRGSWVYILDDDTRLLSPSFVSSLRKVAKNADVIIVKSSRPQLAPHTLPKPDVWKHPEKFRVASTNCLCYVVRRELWQKHIWHFGRRAAGDWWFLRAVAMSQPRYAWLDLVVAETQQLGRARKFEECGANWWKRTVRRFHLKKGPEGWHLPLYKQPKRKPKKKKPVKVAKKSPTPREKRKKRRQKPLPAVEASPTVVHIVRKAAPPPKQNHVILGRRT